MEFPIQDFINLDIQKEQLEAKFKEVPTDMQPLFEQAIKNAEEKIQEYQEKPGFKEALGSVALEIEGRLDSIADLREAAKSGLLPEAEVSAKAAEIEADPRIKVIAKYIGAIAIASESEEKIDPVESPSHPEKEKQPVKMNLIIQGNTIRIGDRGKIVRFAIQEKSVSMAYAKSNEDLLRTLIISNESGLSPRQLWEQTYPEQKYSQDAIRNFRIWAQRLTYRNETLVDQSKRGRGSTYSINPRFDISIIDKKVTKKIAPLKSPKPQEIEEGQVLEIQDSSNPENISENVFPLTLKESVIFAAFMNTYSDELTALGFAPISNEIFHNLLEELGEPSETTGPMKTEDLVLLRQDIVKKLYAFAQNEDALIDAIIELEKNNPNDPRLQLIDYIAEMESDEDRWKLLEELTAFTNRVFIFDSLQGGGVQIRSIKSTLPDGRELDLTQGKTDDEDTLEATAEVEIAETPTILESENSENVEEDLPILEEDQEIVLSEPKQEKHLNLDLIDKIIEEDKKFEYVLEIARQESSSDSNSEESSWTDGFAIAVRDQIQKFIMQGIFSQDNPSSIPVSILKAKSQSRSIGTRTNLERLAKLGIVKKLPKSRPNINNDDLTPEATVAAGMINSFQNIFDNSRKKKIAMDTIIPGLLKIYFPQK
jgi:hypothetical protein